MSLHQCLEAMDDSNNREPLRASMDRTLTSAAKSPRIVQLLTDSSHTFQSKPHKDPKALMNEYFEALLKITKSIIAQFIEVFFKKLLKKQRSIQVVIKNF